MTGRCKWRIMYYEVRWIDIHGSPKREPHAEPNAAISHAMRLRRHGSRAEVYRVQGWDG